MGNKETKKLATFKMKITTFLGIAALVILTLVIIIGQQVLSNMNYVAEVAQNVRQDMIPAMSENQRTFINIESLRRIAEVTYIATDSQKRRAARINAQALAAESVFDRDKEFHAKASRIAASIAKIAKHRDAVHQSENKLHELADDYYVELQILLTNKEANKTKQVLDAFFKSNIAFTNYTHNLPTAPEDIGRIQAKDKELLESIAPLCENISPSDVRTKSACLKIDSLYAKYSEIQQFMLQDHMAATEYWESVDTELRELRDSVSSGSEWNTKEALAGIEDASANAQHIFQLILAGTILFIIVCIVIIQKYLVLPIKWIAQKLRDLQQGDLQVESPNIKIRELSEIAELLERFSSHIVELYSHASQLEEDSAGKKDLEEIMRAVFMASLDGYCIWDEDGLVVVSSGFLELLGAKSKEEVIEHHDFFGFSPDRVQMEKLRRTILNGSFREEFVFRSLQGEPLPLEITHLPIDFRGKRVALRYVRDLRLQKRTEEELREAKQLAEEAARAKSDFLARMSHEIRTPMNGVLGLTHLALEKSPPPEQRQYLEKIQSSARILLGVINDILDFSKIEQDKLTINLAPISLSMLIQTVMGLFLSQASEKKLSFILDKDENVPDALLGDSLRLSQVLLNLCGNAIKFTEKGKVTLRVKLVAEDDEKVNLQFSVIDTGLGLSTEQKEQLFKPFSQVHNYSTRRHGGTGLGLVISQRLVKLMGGDLKVESMTDVGSNFHFTIELKKSNEIQKQVEAACAPKDSSPLKGISLLLVEDNDINQEIAKDLLEGMGGSVTIACNGAESLEILKTKDFDIILMDIQMPIMDGLTATELIRKTARPEIRNIPIFAMTAHVMQEDREKSLEVGMDEHITKPIDINELCGKILEIMKKKEKG